jgi:hypothetical protein
MKMKRDSSAKPSNRKGRKKLVYVRTMAEIPDFKSDDEIAAWYQTHSTILIQDKLETLPAKVAGKLRSRLKPRRDIEGRRAKGLRHTRAV